MIDAVGYGILVPACVAACVAWLCQRLLGGGVAGRSLAVLGLPCGYLAGYALAIEGTWVPERNWHWLPYLAIAAGLIGIVAAIDSSSLQRNVSKRLLLIATPVLFLILAIAASWALVPTWLKPEPAWTSRTVQIPACAGLLAMLLLVYRPLPARVAAHSFVPLLSLSAFSTAAFLAARISLNYGQLAGLAAAGFVGNAVVFWRRNDVAGLRGLLPAWVVLLEGTAYVGCIYPREPIYGLLIAPAAPLALCAFCRGPLSRLRGMRRVICEYGLVLLVLTGTAALLFADSFHDSGSEW